MADDKDVVYIADLLHTCLEVLRDADGPLRGTEVLDRVAARTELTPYELEPNDAGTPRWQVVLNWRTGEAATVGWMTKRRGFWSLTEAGEAALEQYDADSMIVELRRRYAEVRQKRQDAAERLQGYERTIARALSCIDVGSWTAYEDLAELSGVEPETIIHFLAQARPCPDGAHRVAHADGSLPSDGMLNVRYRGTDLGELLREEGIEFGPNDRASQDQRVTAAQIAERLDELDAETAEVEPPGRRAWLVRGSSVDGRDLVPVWLERGSVSLAAARLAAVSPPVSRDELKRLVDAGYSGKSYAARDQKVNEFDAFCNLMRPGDYLLTTSQGKTYVGEVTGPAAYTGSEDNRSNLRRTARWLNPDEPVAFTALPAPLPTRLHSQQDVVELTDDIPAIEQMLREAGLSAEGERPPQKPAAGLRPFEQVPDSLAEDLLFDRAWLNSLVETLWEKKQVILQGPPGTGKTYLARKLAAHLTNDAGALKFVQFHPAYTYEDFFEGFRPVRGDDGTLSFELKPGPLRRLVDAAKDHPGDPYLLLIDEINRANLAKVFGELYFLLEYRDEQVELLYSAEEFVLPPNVFVIGTMNTADRSIALVDDAMRRRFDFLDLRPDREPVAGLLDRWLHRLPEAEYPYNRETPQILDRLNRAIESPDLAIGPSYLMRESIYQNPDGLARVWRGSIMPLLEEHHYGAPAAELAAFELDSLRGAAVPPDGAP